MTTPVHAPVPRRRRRSLPRGLAAAALALTAACGSGGDDDDLFLFVADMGGDKIVIFDLDADGLPDANPERVITGPATRLDRPYDLAVDGHGRLFVASLGVAPGAGRLTIYHDDADGDATPRRDIDLAGSSSLFYFHALQPVGIDARAHSEDILAAFADQAVVVEFEFNGTSQIPTGEFFGLDMESAADVAHDGNRGRVLVADRTRNAVLAYPDLRGNTRGLDAEEELSGPATLLDDPISLDVDGAGRIYVLNYGNGSVTVYDDNVLGVGGIEGDIAPLRRLGGPAAPLADLTGATGLAVSPGGRLYVVHGNSVKVFAAGAHGNQAPLTVLTSPEFVMPTGVAVGED